MTDILRRITKVEFAESGLAPGAPSSILSMVTNSAFASVERRALLVGGYHGAGPVEGCSVNQVLEYDLTTRQWTNLTPTLGLSEPRSEGAMVAVGQTYYLFGGYNDSTVVASMLKLTVPPGESAKGASWTPVKEGPTGPSARRGHSLTVVGGADADARIFLFGGFDGNKRLDDLWEFKVATESWSLVSTTGVGPTPRDSHVTVFDPLEKRLVVFGGFGSARLNDVYFLDLSSLVWTSIAVDVSPSPRAGCFGVYHGGFLVAGLGQDAKGPTNACFHFNLDLKKWTLPQLEGDELEAATQFAFCPADSGRRLLLFGGFNDKRYSSNLFEVELERTEPLAAAKGKK